jgi:hypothetical protein
MMDDFIYMLKDFWVVWKKCLVFVKWDSGLQVLLILRCRREDREEKKAEKGCCGCGRTDELMRKEDLMMVDWLPLIQILECSSMAVNSIG